MWFPSQIVQNLLKCGKKMFGTPPHNAPTHNKIITQLTRVGQKSKSTGIHTAYNGYQQKQKGKKKIFTLLFNYSHSFLFLYTWSYNIVFEFVKKYIE